MELTDTDRLAVPRAEHAARRERAEQQARALDGQSARIANLRTLAVVAAIGLWAAGHWDKLGPWSLWAAVASALGFVVLAVLHQRVLDREARAKQRVLLSERGVARCSDGWHRFATKGEQYLTPDHLYAADLDVFGQGSLFQLIDETATRAGEAQLAQLLAKASPLPEIHERQQAIQELAPRIDYRESLTVEGRLAAKDKPDPASFLRWAELPPQLDPIRWARPVAWVLPLITLTIAVLSQFGITRLSWTLPPIALQLLVTWATRGVLRDYYARLSAGEAGLLRFHAVFAAAESEQFDSPLLQQLTQGLTSTEDRSPVSVHMARFARLLSFAELRQSGQLHAPIQLFTLWDIHWLSALERWRRRHGQAARAWFEALAELEALCSLAGFAHDRPHFTFPELVDHGPLFEATGLGHPLLDAPVLNDVSLAERPRSLLITGSNMSGKTTLVRAMGANTVLALAGAPVCAQALSVSHLTLLTSMRVKDSLERGVSYFYAEVQRLKAVLDGAQAAKGQAMFLLDEILLGTNTRERQLASREVLRLLLDTGAIGAVTTHDLSLAELERERHGEVKTVHFRDQLLEGKMSFDYRLREGVVDTTNALRVLKLAGIPVTEEEAPAPQAPPPLPRKR